MRHRSARSSFWIAPILTGVILAAAFLIALWALLHPPFWIYLAFAALCVGEFSIGVAAGFEAP